MEFPNEIDLVPQYANEACFVSTRRQYEYNR